MYAVKATKLNNIYYFNIVITINIWSYETMNEMWLRIEKWCNNILHSIAEGYIKVLDSILGGNYIM